MKFKVTVNNDTEKINESFLVSEERMLFLNGKLSEALKLQEDDCETHATIMNCIQHASEHAISANEVAYITFKMTQAVMRADFEKQMARITRAFIEK